MNKIAVKKLNLVSMPGSGAQILHTTSTDKISVIKSFPEREHDGHVKLSSS